MVLPVGNYGVLSGSYTTPLPPSGQDQSVNKAGIVAVEAVLKDARKLAKNLSPEKRAEVEKICDEISKLLEELRELQARGEVHVYNYIGLHAILGYIGNSSILGNFHC